LGVAAVFFFVNETQDAFVVYKLHGTGWTITEAEMSSVSESAPLNLVSDDIISYARLPCSDCVPYLRFFCS
jgi:hypothetical protein